jgi:hypothetical protein
VFLPKWSFGLRLGGAAPAKTPPQVKTPLCRRAGGVICHLPGIQNGHKRNDSSNFILVYLVGLRYNTIVFRRGGVKA